mmetsp:Transcript_69128/g.156298  ORF Transcript_69128/g.156298 Transcript_69128/m.156298 type:complete len:99 (+) Transcript_69128:2-298(+)
MVTQWGYANDALGTVAWEGPNGSSFGSPQMASEATQAQIDAEVRAVVDRAYARCKALLVENRALLDEVTATLVRDETIGNDQLKDLVKTHSAKSGTLV